MLMKNVLRIIAVVMLAVSVSFESYGYTAATAAVNTKARTGMTAQFGVYTNTIIYQGSIVCINSAGYAVAGADASGNIVVGRALQTIDNRVNATGAGDSGALKIDVDRGVFGWAGSGVSKTDIGSFAYVLDSKTVTNASAGNAIIAGTIVDYSDSLVWVDTFNVGRTAGSYTTLAASGNSTVGGTLIVTGAATLSSTAALAGKATFTLSPRLNATAGTAATGVATITNAPSTLLSVGAPFWVPIQYGTNTCYFPVWQY